jgi:outer membrane protein
VIVQQTSRINVAKTLLWGSLAALALATPVWAAELKIGYVNYGQLMEQSPQAKAIADAIRSEFIPRQRDLQNAQQSLKNREDKLQKDGATMSDEQRAREEKELRDGYRDLDKKRSEAQDDFNARRNEELSRLQRTLIEEVRVYAKAQNFDLIVADGVIYANPVLDITPAILSQLQAHGAKAAAGAGAASSPGPVAPAPAAPAKSSKPTPSH